LQFDDFWSKSIDFLRGKLEADGQGREQKLFISNWRPDKDLSHEAFPIRDIAPDKLTCLTIHAGKSIEIPRDNMATLYELWDDFLDGRTPRIEIVEKVPRTTYAISIMKYLKDNIK
jgi:hypothetical protein